jgi:hypothetical protein
MKRSGREADHSPPSNAEVKNAWSYTSTPQYVFMTWCLVKHRDSFTFTLTLSQRLRRVHGKGVRVLKDHTMNMNGGVKVKFHALSNYAPDRGGRSVSHFGRFAAGWAPEAGRTKIIPVNV